MATENTHSEFIQGEGWSAFVDGIPDTCQHEWNGEGESQFEDGEVVKDSVLFVDVEGGFEINQEIAKGRFPVAGWVTCSKCGKPYEIDMFMI